MTPWAHSFVRGPRLGPGRAWLAVDKMRKDGEGGLAVPNPREGASHVCWVGTSQDTSWKWDPAARAWRPLAPHSGAWWLPLPALPPGLPPVPGASS